MGEDNTEEDKGPKFEDILDVVGPMGPAQIVVLLFSYAIEIAGGLSSDFFVVESGNPGYTCIPVNRSSGEVGNITLNGCPTEEMDCVNVTYSDTYTSLVTEFDFICGVKYKARLTTSIYFLGMLVGGAVFGPVSDAFGRRRPLLAGFILIIATQALLATAQSWPVYIFLRLLTGVFTGYCSGGATVLPMEYVGTKWRAIVGIRMGWRLAHFSIPLFAYLVRDWRHLTLSISLIHTPIFVLACFFMPESSRWLIRKHRYGEAHQCLKFVAKLNRRPPPDVALLQRVGETDDHESQSKARYSYLDLFRTRHYVKVTLVLLNSWFATSIISNGIKNEFTTFTGSLYINLLIAAVANMVARCLAPVVITFLGRRWGLPVFSALPITSLFTLLALDLTGYIKGREGIRTGLALASYGSATGNWLLNFVYTCEVYPTLIRCMGISAGHVAGRLGMAVAPQIGLLGDIHQALPYAVIGTTALVASVLMVTLMPETKDKPLPEEMPPRRNRKQKDKQEVTSEDEEKMDVSAI